MFWGSSYLREDSYSAESDSSDFSDPEDAGWARTPRHDKKRSRNRKRRGQAAHESGQWFGGLFGWDDKPSSQKKNKKRGRKSKSRAKSCRPKSPQGWGVFFLAILLSIYLLDFFNLLYRRNTRESEDKGQRVKLPMEVKKSELVNTKADVRESAQANSTGDRGSSGSTSSTGSTARLDAGTSVGESHENSEGSFNSTSHKTTSLIDGESSKSETESSSVMNSGPDVGHPNTYSGELLKHPMNRNMEELQVPGNTGLLSLDSIKEYYRKLAKAYLSTFTGGVHRQMYFDILRRRTYALTPPGANKGAQTILFQIIDKKIYMMDPYEVPRNSKPFYRTRINQVIWLLSKLAEEGRVKNTEFLMAIHDCVQTVNKPHTYRGAHYQESNPTFTIVSCNFSDNIPFPMWEGSKNRDGGFSGWDETVKKYSEDETPWEKKQNKAVFRGGNRPSMFFRNKTDADSHCHDVGRTRLQYLSQQQPDVLDVSIGGTCGGVRTALDRLEPKEHHKFKYILYAEGNCMWADRTKHQVFGPSTMIKQETPCGQFFEPLMKPNTHYVPTDFFFTDTVDKVMWARQNDEQAHAIVKNANEFGHNFLSLKGIEAYAEVLLEEYTALLVEPDIKLENGAVDVTNKVV